MGIFEGGGKERNDLGGGGGIEWGYLREGGGIKLFGGGGGRNGLFEV